MRRALIPVLLAPLWACSPATESPAPARYSVTEAASPDGTPLVVLTDSEGGVEAAVAPSKGADLSSVRVRLGDEWVETLYLARDYAPREGWTGKGPTLWPAVGRNLPPDLGDRNTAGDTLPRGGWDHDGVRYPMPGHGFARDFPWEVTGQGADESGAFVRLSLVDSPETRESYPFGFRVELEHRVFDGRVQLDYRVAADGDNESAMPFSIGNHITFKTPLVPGGDPLAVELVTPSLTEILKEAGLPTGQTRERSHAEAIRLGEFEVREAVSLTGYEGDPWVELRDAAGLTIRLSHTASQVPEQPVVLFNLWGDAAAGFFSPEPWVGLQNSLVLGQGLVRLEPGEAFEWTVRIEPTVPSKPQSARLE